MFENFVLETPRQPGTTLETKRKTVYRNGSLMVIVALKCLAGFREGIYYRIWKDNLQKCGSFLDLALSRCLVDIDAEFDTNIRQCLEDPKIIDETFLHVNSEYIGTVAENMFLYRFMQAAECLPVAITLHAVVLSEVDESNNTTCIKCTTQTSLAVVYANEMCSRLTGYERLDLLSIDIMTIESTTLSDARGKLSKHMSGSCIPDDRQALLTSSKKTCVSMSDFGSDPYESSKKHPYIDISHNNEHIHNQEHHEHEQNEISQKKEDIQRSEISYTVMSCSNKQGEKYDRMVGKKFIQKTSTKQTYVIAVHMDVTLELNRNHMARFIQELLSKLPDLVN